MILAGGLGTAFPKMLSSGLGFPLTGLPAGALLWSFTAPNLPAADYYAYTDEGLTTPAVLYDAEGVILTQPVNSAGGTAFYSTESVLYVSSDVTGGRQVPSPESFAYAPLPPKPEDFVYADV